MKINTLTPSEESLMQVLWLLNSAYMREVMDSHPEPKPHQNTVSTYLKILVEKKFLKTKKEGRIFRYSVAISYEDYKNFLLKNFIAQYFNDSSLDIIEALLDQNLLSVEELKSIGKLKSSKSESSEIQEYITELTQPAEKKKKKKKSKKNDRKDKKKKKK